MKRAGFTLADLCVVIVTILILAALLSSILRPPEHGNWKGSTCQSNLKQIGLGFKQYTQDYDELFPRYNVGRVGSTTSGNYTATHWVRAMQPYTKSLPIFQCPSENNALGTDYYFNRRVSGRTEADFSNSARSVLLTEGTDTSYCADATATAAITAGTPAAYSRHLDGSNYAFIDGHVKWLQSSQTPAQQPASKGGFTFNS